MSRHSKQTKRSILLRFQVHRGRRSWRARALGHAIFTQGRTPDDLYNNIKEAAGLHFKERVEKGEPLRIMVVAEAEIRRGHKRATR